MVRQPGDDEVVGRHLAERGLRHLDGEQAAGGLEAGVAGRARRRRGHAGRARASTRCGRRAPIRTKVETPDEINEVFDAIAYEKTAAVLRMIEAYVGAEAFRKGVASYLKKYSYGNAAGEDFWTEMTRVTGQAGRSHHARASSTSPARRVLSVRQLVRRQDTSEIDGRAVAFLRHRRAPHPRAADLDASGLLQDAATARRACELIERPAQTVDGRTRATPSFANADSRGYYFSEYTAGDGARAGRTSARR